MQDELPKIGCKFLTSLFNTNQDQLTSFFKIVLLIYIVHGKKKNDEFNIEKMVLETYFDDIIFQGTLKNYITQADYITPGHTLVFSIDEIAAKASWDIYEPIVGEFEEIIPRKDIFHSPIYKALEFVKGRSGEIIKFMEDTKERGVHYDITRKEFVFDIPYIDDLMKLSPQEIWKVDSESFLSKALQSWLQVLVT